MGKYSDSVGVGTLDVAIALLWHKLCSSVPLFLHPLFLSVFLFLWHFRQRSFLTVFVKNYTNEVTC